MKLKIKKILAVGMLSIIVFSGCTTQIENTKEQTNEIEQQTESDEKTARVEVGRKMYITEECFLLLEPKKDSNKVNKFDVGRAVEILKINGEWCYVKALHIRRNDADIDDFDHYDTQGWIQKTNIGYYETLSSNIGVDVKIKKGYEPEWAQNSSTEVWGKIGEETKSEFTLLFDSSMYVLKKEYVDFLK